MGLGDLLFVLRTQDLSCTRKAERVGFNARLEGQKVMKTDLELVKREGYFCVSGIWDICVLHDVESSWITECFDCARVRTCQ